MSQSPLSGIIREHGLTPGSVMRDVNGDEIPGSVVLADHKVLIPGETPGSYDLHAVNPILGEETIVHLDATAIAVMRAMAI